MVSTRVCQFNSAISGAVLGTFLPALFLSVTLSNTAMANPIVTDKNECVIVLHGLARTANAMKKLATALEADYRVINNTYPSRKHTIEKLAELAIMPAIKHCETASKVHLVTHSLGGILARQYLASHKVENLGNVVMLGPPNQGSEIVDYFLASPFRAHLFNLANGPAGQQLGTLESSKPKALGSVNFSLGVIAGDKSYNPILSSVLPSEGDGKVTVESSKVDGMVDHLTLPVDHTFMMRDDRVIAQVQYFLSNARFSRNAD